MKYLNAISSGFSLLTSSFTRKAVISGMPASVSMELTNHCNLHCHECPSGAGTMKRERGFMDIAFFRKVTGELKPFLFNTNLYFQGEPMLHPDFFNFIDEAKAVHPVVSTNGHFINQANAEKLARSAMKKIIISLDGTSQEVYSHYRRNGNVEKVKEGITLLSRAVKEVHSSLKVEIQVLVNRHNEKQLDEIKAFATKSGASLALKSMQIYDEKSYEEWLPSGGQFRRYETSGKNVGIKSSFPRRCPRVWLNPVVTWDGAVLPCCFDKDGDHVMGDLNKQTFREIWHGDKYREFRQRILSGREKIEICKNCTSGLPGVKT